MTTKAIESAVLAFQLYAGSGGCPIKTQQKFYARAMKKAEAIARAKGMAEHDAVEQISREAQRRGVVIPRPGKDY